MKHPLTIENYPGSLTDLANELGDLRYDALADFLAAFSAKLAVDSEQDALRGRPQLAQSLLDCATAISTAKASIDRAWMISEPFMKGSDDGKNT